ncbi:hypothetical protein ACOSQ2_022949 [Xanthoceras sorbifolium]
MAQDEQGLLSFSLELHSLGSRVGRGTAHALRLETREREREEGKRRVAGRLLAPSDVVVGLVFDTAVATEESDVPLSSCYR